MFSAFIFRVGPTSGGVAMSNRSLTSTRTTIGPSPTTTPASSSTRFPRGSGYPESSKGSAPKPSLIRNACQKSWTKRHAGSWLKSRGGITIPFGGMGHNWKGSEARSADWSDSRIGMIRVIREDGMLSSDHDLRGPTGSIQRFPWQKSTQSQPAEAVEGGGRVRTTKSPAIGTSYQVKPTRTERSQFLPNRL